MRYRITLSKENDPQYEVVIFRDFKERVGAKKEPITLKKLSSVSEIYNILKDEMKGQSAFDIQQIEEVPED